MCVRENRFFVVYPAVCVCGLCVWRARPRCGGGRGGREARGRDETRGSRHSGHVEDGLVHAWVGQIVTFFDESGLLENEPTAPTEQAHTTQRQ